MTRALPSFSHPQKYRGNERPVGFLIPTLARSEQAAAVERNQQQSEWWPKLKLFLGSWMCHAVTIRDGERANERVTAKLPRPPPPNTKTKMTVVVCARKRQPNLHPLADTPISAILGYWMHHAADEKSDAWRVRSRTEARPRLRTPLARPRHCSPAAECSTQQKRRATEEIASTRTTAGQLSGTARNGSIRKGETQMAAEPASARMIATTSAVPRLLDTSYSKRRKRRKIARTWTKANQLRHNMIRKKRARCCAKMTVKPLILLLAHP